jgi:hypothetical protein
MCIDTEKKMNYNNFSIDQAIPRKRDAAGLGMAPGSGLSTTPWDASHGVAVV